MQKGLKKNKRAPKKKINKFIERGVISSLFYIIKVNLKKIKVDLKNIIEYYYHMAKYSNEFQGELI